MRTPAQARRQVNGALARLDPPSPAQVHDVLLVASELVTNAQRHAGGVTAFAVDVDDDTVTITVGDSSPRLPRRGRLDELRLGGYGWPIVQHLCRELTVDVAPTGKTIHATLPLDH